jgi:hypothetical protein
VAKVRNFCMTNLMIDCKLNLVCLDFVWNIQFKNLSSFLVNFFSHGRMSMILIFKLNYPIDGLYFRNVVDGNNHLILNLAICSYNMYLGRNWAKNIMKKMGVLQLALQVNFWVTIDTCNSPYLYVVSAIKQVAKIAIHRI